MRDGAKSGAGNSTSTPRRISNRKSEESTCCQSVHGSQGGSSTHARSASPFSRSGPNDYSSALGIAFLSRNFRHRKGIEKKKAHRHEFSSRGQFVARRQRHASLRARRALNPLLRSISSVLMPRGWRQKLWKVRAQEEHEELSRTFYSSVECPFDHLRLTFGGKRVRSTEVRKIFRLNFGSPELRM